jgi:hypothetical protein
MFHQFHDDEVDENINLHEICVVTHCLKSDIPGSNFVPEIIDFYPLFFFDDRGTTMR